MGMDVPHLLSGSGHPFTIVSVSKETTGMFYGKMTTTELSWWYMNVKFPFGLVERIINCYD